MLEFNESGWLKIVQSLLNPIATLEFYRRANLRQKILRGTTVGSRIYDLWEHYLKVIEKSRLCQISRSFNCAFGCQIILTFRATRARRVIRLVYALTCIWKLPLQATFSDCPLEMWRQQAEQLLQE